MFDYISQDLSDAYTNIIGLEHGGRGTPYVPWPPVLAEQVPHY